MESVVRSCEVQRDLSEMMGVAGTYLPSSPPLPSAVGHVASATEESNIYFICFHFYFF